MYIEISITLHTPHPTPTPDRFTSLDDEIDGKWSLAFITDAQGSVYQAKVSLDEKEVSFTKKADEKLSDLEFLKTLTEKYQLNGGTLNLVISDNGLIIASAPSQHLDPYKNNVFRIREFSDQMVEFLFDSSGKLTGLKKTYDGKNVTYKKLK